MTSPVCHSLKLEDLKVSHTLPHTLGGSLGFFLFLSKVFSKKALVQVITGRKGNGGKGTTDGGTGGKCTGDGRWNEGSLFLSH